MSEVVVLIAPRPLLGDREAAAVRAALELAGARVGAPRWLAPGEACELPVAGLPARAAESAARLAVAGRPIDVAALPAEGRRKRLLVADLESTIIENEMLVEMADLAGFGAAMADATARTMAGERDFAQSLRERVARFAGAEAALLDRAALRIRPMAGARTLVATMRRHGATAALVSGGFTVFAEPVARELGFERVAANRLVVENGRLTGRVVEPVLDRAAKLAFLEQVARELGLGLADTMTVGDGANDIPMLEAAGIGVAFRAKPVAAAAARARLDHADLTGLLFLQGYARDEFVAG